MRIITTIVYHHTGISGDNQAEGIIRNHTAKWPMQFPHGMAYHMLIEKSGKTIEGRPEFSVGYHAGNWLTNLVSIGIALEGNFIEHKPTEAQLDSLAEETIDICTRNKIRWENVRLHRDVRDTPTTCPCVDLKRILEKTGRIESAKQKKLEQLRNVKKYQSSFTVNILRNWLIERKISFLETQF